MTDEPEPSVTPARAALMARVRQKNTRPELIVRRALHALGRRFRLHRRDLPGRPDIVLPGRNLAIFVHGCFWHRHPGCKASSTPKTRAAFWNEKFAANIARDARNIAQLEAIGWRTAVVWECETRDRAALSERLAVLVGDEPSGGKI